jgi:hypothetical protein
MPANEDIQRVADILYAEDAKPCDIPNDKAQEFGALLINNGFRIRYSYIVRSASELTVANMLSEFDKHTRYERSTTEVISEHGGIVGPYYSTSEGRVFCPIGVAVWMPKHT